jgi:hypothetical protein
VHKSPEEVVPRSSLEVEVVPRSSLEVEVVLQLLVPEQRPD